MKKILLLISFFIFLTIHLQGQWGSLVGENVQLTNDGGAEYNVLIEPAPDDGWYVSYTAVEGNKNIVHLTRVDSTGIILWDIIIHDLSEVGLPLATMISDNAGGVIMAWEDQRADTTVFVYANRIAPDGTKMWGNDDIRVGVSESAESCPKLISDGNNGAIITLVDNNPPPGNFLGLYAYRVNASGNVLWRTFLFRGVDLCQSADLDLDGEGGLLSFYIFSHIFDQENQLRGMRLDSLGNKLWTDDFFDFLGFQVPIGLKFYGTMDGLSSPNIHFAPSVGIYVVYFENPFGGGNRTHQGHLVNLDGMQLWAADGITLNDPSDISPDVQTVIDQDGNLYFNYHTDSDWELQKVLPDGSLPWTVDGVSYSSASQANPDNLVITSCNDVMVSFDGVDQIIHASRIAGDGSMVYDPPMLPLSVDQIDDQHRDPVIAINENDRVLVIWADDENINDSDWNLKMHGFHKNGMLGNPTNVQNLERSDIEIFPNPISTNEFLQIKTNEIDFGNILLFDLNGREIHAENNINFSNGLVNFRLPDKISAGIYFLQIVSKNGILAKKLNIF